jgi:alanine-synthesizing transaminase
MLLEEANVAVSPGNGFGEYGENYVRIALVENRQRLRQACRNIKQFMTAHGVNAAAAPRPRKRAVAEVSGK